MGFLNRQKCEAYQQVYRTYHRRYTDPICGFGEGVDAFTVQPFSLWTWQAANDPQGGRAKPSIGNYILSAW